ncbi:MAG TPA: diguanylate cyclase [Thermoanaerobaculia bacterium]|nr:diguanylate cyclase [Thermoanaerobaculia bacterium]
MPHTVAIVEDDRNVLRMLALHLGRAGYEVRSAGSVEEGRKMLRGGGWQMAMLDRKLPDGDGLELACEARRTFPHNYILMLTGEDSEEAKLEGFDCGADDYVTKPFQVQELLARIRAGLRIVELQEKLLELTVTDPLTGLRNRRAFEKELSVQFERSRRYGRPLSLIIVDVDHFKSINDTWGHGAGDVVLADVAHCVARQTRSSDLVARIGGEEFAVLLPETPLLEALQVAEKIRVAVASVPLRTGSVEIPVTISAGVANVPHSEIADAAQLVHAADQALYRAKERGRNRIEMEKRRHRFERLAVA